MKNFAFERVLWAFWAVVVKHDDRDYTMMVVTKLQISEIPAAA